VVDALGIAKAVLTKQDITHMLAGKKSSNYLDVLEKTVTEAIAERPDNRSAPYTTPTITIGETVAKIVADEIHHCVFVVDDRFMPIAAVAVVDLMEYILNWSECTKC